MPWRRNLQPIVRPLYQAYSRLSRGATLGVRGLVLNDAGEVLLVEHTYTHGWFLPGGGVERGETCEAAVIRELREEGGVSAVRRPTLIGIHANHRTFRGDHVLLYRIDAWTPCEPTAHAEILARGWFAPDNLPSDTTASTRQRLAEALHGAERSADW
jgi:ADP-ribose pyrophosphatase YjhB (NUDIX family)